MPTKTATKDSERTLADDRDKLVSDLKTLIEDAKLLTTDAAETSQEVFSEKAAQVQAQLKDGLEKLKEHGQVAKEKGQETLDTVEKLIKDNPWKSLGIALLAGIVIDRLARD
ncbi:DUF883 family protein [Ruficoccus amylovorans]|uniref:DUF883 family protein n=1 Tax=Ruficoccus amylovorans TaxID=1804625 RepID=A0A842HFS8_9BACT|nr:DUF883 family protein [Ruficoccus amylovorans]MBC2595129.1 DUF883 family protein [Ruficoccus amylovorans]